MPEWTWLSCSKKKKSTSVGTINLSWLKPCQVPLLETNFGKMPQMKIDQLIRDNEIFAYLLSEKKNAIFCKLKWKEYHW